MPLFKRKSEEGSLVECVLCHYNIKKYFPDVVVRMCPSCKVLYCRTCGAKALKRGKCRFCNETTLKIKRPSRNPFEDTKVKIEQERENKYKTLMGMIRIENKLDLKEASKITGYSMQDLKQLIYRFASDGKINGKFEGDFFIIEKGLDLFIEGLDKQFAEWSQKEIGKIEKKE